MSLSCPCLSFHVPSHMSLSSLPLELPVQLLLSPTLFLLTCLLRLLPTQVSCPVVPPTPWVLVKTVSTLVCVFGKLGVAGLCPASGSLFLQLGGCFFLLLPPPPLPPHHIPLPLWQEHEWAACVASRVILGHHPIQDEGG